MIPLRKKKIYIYAHMTWFRKMQSTKKKKKLKCVFFLYYYWLCTPDYQFQYIYLFLRFKKLRFMSIFYFGFRRGGWGKFTINLGFPSWLQVSWITTVYTIFVALRQTKIHLLNNNYYCIEIIICFSQIVSLFNSMVLRVQDYIALRFLQLLPNFELASDIFSAFLLWLRYSFTPLAKTSLPANRKLWSSCLRNFGQILPNYP